jgi:hypothetical protein
VKKVLLYILILFTASPVLAQTLPNWLEKQVRSGSLSRQEAVLLQKGSQSIQPKALVPEIKVEQKKATPQVSSASTVAATVMSPDCPESVVSEIRARFPYDTIVDGPRFGNQRYTETLDVFEGNLRNISSGDSDTMFGRFLTAIKESSPFTTPICGRPSGKLTVSATNSENSIKQWSLKIALVNSTLK